MKRNLVVSLAIISAPLFHAIAADRKVSQEPVEVKIARALSAGPPQVTADATVAEPAEKGELHILRQGRNGWTCLPGSNSIIGDPPMCEDAVALQWNQDREEGKPHPTTSVPGIEYMLGGATQRSDTDPHDMSSPAIKIGPHWMILWPFDPKTSGLPTVHKDSGAYIMYAGTPWAHIHVMGAP
ncbi:hypothetical protein GLI01_20720 [Gluconacetobacter liquefaciens]|nr:hypothetical protein [Gluconacetobacter liquefaciens]MBB2185462.1 hypothetical protein [Gluconacetobacter liquefaciens]GEB38037.1 hypothetical protein GLI01_20720 [Gluconacetobacter liquefaciens]